MHNKITLFLCLLAACFPACRQVEPTATPEAAVSTAVPTAFISPTEPPPPTETPSLDVTQMPAGHPGPHVLGDMVYHQRLGMVVMANGSEDNRLWGWDGELWRILGDEGPVGRTNSGLVYDLQRDKLVLYGGRSVTTTDCIADTWEWDAQGWQEIEVPGPDACSHFTMEYDSTLGKVLLFGGGDAQTNPSSEMWTWDGRTWEKLNAQTPTPRFHAMSASDNVHGAISLIGGFDVNNQMFDEMWSWDGSAWEQLDIPRPPALSHARMVFDSNRVQLVLFGGSTRARIPLELQGETWILTGGSWQQANINGPQPSPRGGQMMAYDPSRDQVVLYGGFDADDQGLADTWAWDGIGWICVDSCETAAPAP